MFSPDPVLTVLALFAFVGIRSPKTSKPIRQEPPRRTLRRVQEVMNSEALRSHRGPSLPKACPFVNAGQPAFYRPGQPKCLPESMVGPGDGTEDLLYSMGSGAVVAFQGGD